MNEKDIKDLDTVNKIGARSIQERILRLVKGLYLVTSLLKDSEPLKGHLREAALSIVSDISQRVAGENLPYKSVGVEMEISAQITKLISLIDVARTGKIFSEMNGRILYEEITNIAELVSKNIRPENSGMLSADFFSRQQEDFLSLGGEIENNKGHLQNYPGNSIRHSVNLQQNNKKSLSRISQNKGVQNEDRRNKIVHFIKDKEKVGIADLVGVIKGCSEKTIQREVIALVVEGVLKKEGERRWSRYSIA